MKMLDSVMTETVALAKTIFGNEFIPLHRPVFEGNERQYLVDCIDSNFVSSVGEKVTEFEEKVAEFTGSKYAIATVNGTAALHAAILLSGVKPGDEVISQALTFIATCNAINYSGADPVFVDVDEDTMGMSPEALKRFLEGHAEKKDGMCFNKSSGRRIAACIPMHTFGLPCRIAEIADICADWDIALIEDAAESLGSYVDDKHTGTFSSMATLSFNGNKVITTGGGGAILTNNADLARRAKHITTTAKVPHAWEFIHDEIGYNYRLPNLNAALGCAQIEQLPGKLIAKRMLFDKYQAAFSEVEGSKLLAEPAQCISNYWLQTIMLNVDHTHHRDDILKATNEAGLMTRPVWRLLHQLTPFAKCPRMDLSTAEQIAQRLINIPSSPSLLGIVE